MSDIIVHWCYIILQKLNILKSYTTFQSLHLGSSGRDLTRFTRTFPPFAWWTASSGSLASSPKLSTDLTSSWLAWGPSKPWLISVAQLQSDPSRQINPMFTSRHRPGPLLSHSIEGSSLKLWFDSAWNVKMLSRKYILRFWWKLERTFLSISESLPEVWIRGFFLGFWWIF